MNHHRSLRFLPYLHRNLQDLEARISAAGRAQFEGNLVGRWRCVYLVAGDVSRMVCQAACERQSQHIACPGSTAYDCLSGNHCVVSVGHSSAVLNMRSYKKGAFFFHILYSSRSL